MKVAHHLTRWLFLRGLGAVYGLAFASLWAQLQALAGPRGLVPAEQALAAAHARLGAAAYWQSPTLAWLTGADAPALHGLCAAGVLASVLMMLNLAPGAAALAAWALYLSLCELGGPFLHFQWDNLLLETGLLALVYAPWGWRPGVAAERPPSRLVVWALRLLVFKLMLLSGVVKLTSGDPVWRDLSALTYHYWTTCLPTWTGWWVHQLPRWFHQLSVAGMFAIELLVPFAIFAPRRVRAGAALAFVGLQVFIGATGNYGFFNLLSALLCVPLLDDAFTRRLLPRWFTTSIPELSPPVFVPLWRRAPAWLVCAVVLPLSAAHLAGRVAGYQRLPEPVLAAVRALAPLRSVNSYGLFANMTTERPEIVIEGSADGETWIAYEFAWKPGDPLRAPDFVQPHMPRVDWQMWFAALGHHKRNPWFMALLRRLLEGSPEVRALLAHDPFPDAPPVAVRATVYQYRFTTLDERRASGAWWTRTQVGPYCPVQRR